MALAILSASVFTGDPARPRAEALGVENGEIVAVGSNDEVMSTLRGKVEEFRLPGRSVTPGLVDGHCHFLSYGLYLKRMRCDWASPGCIPAKDPSNGKPSMRWTEPGTSRCGCIACCRRKNWTTRRPAGFDRRMAASASGPGT